MIGFLRGIVESVTEGTVLLDVGGVGYEVQMPAGLLNTFAPVGSELKVYTYLSVKEDGVSLYGFPTRDALGLFRLLITVSGIGPKGAQSVLGVLSPDELRFAILAGDAKAIARAPGIGKKSAERVILDLRDKLGTALPERDTAALPAASGTGTGGNNAAAQEEAAEALIALGYSSTEAYRAVRLADTEEKADAGAILKAALKHL